MTNCLFNYIKTQGLSWGAPRFTANISPFLFHIMDCQTEDVKWMTRLSGTDYGEKRESGDEFGGRISLADDVEQKPDRV